MALAFNKPPSQATVPPTPFLANVSDEKLQEFKTLVRLSKLAPPTYEGLQKDRKYGITNEWLADAREKWLRFDWRPVEDHINSFPQFTYDIEGMAVHFVALFSEKKDAVPVTLIHGWPGSFLEFIPFLSTIRKKNTPSTLPCHFIVPSLPGFTFSSGPPLDRDFTSSDTARVINQVMVNLGFGENGYVAQGGDIGSIIGRKLAVDFDACKAVHLNAVFMTKPPNLPETSISEAENQRRLSFSTTGSAYAMEHSTRPSTIGSVLSTNPVALLAWIGEKFLDWVDEPLPLDIILQSVTLYWLTDTIPRCIYHYREAFLSPNAMSVLDPRWYIHKPFGFSYLPKEMMPTPKSWVEVTGNLVFWKEHEKGGHFAALERPDDLARDVVAFAEQVGK